MSPLDVRTTRPPPLVTISLSFPEILILIRYMADFSFHEVLCKEGQKLDHRGPSFTIRWSMGRIATKQFPLDRLRALIEKRSPRGVVERSESGGAS